MHFVRQVTNAIWTQRQKTKAVWSQKQETNAIWSQRQKTNKQFGSKGKRQISNLDPKVNTNAFGKAKDKCNLKPKEKMQFELKCNLKPKVRHKCNLYPKVNTNAVWKVRDKCNLKPKAKETKSLLFDVRICFHSSNLWTALAIYCIRNWVAKCYF